jgi:signal transduction histidine kinase/CheY-like chemotaxis protein
VISSTALDFLASAGSELLDCRDITACLESFYRRLSHLLGLDVVVHYELPAHEKALRLVVCVGAPADVLPSLQTLDLGQAVCGAVGLRGQPEVVCAALSSTDPRTELIRRMGLRAYACHPLLYKGTVIGTLSFGSRQQDSFSDATLSMLKATASQVAMVVHRRRMEDELRASERRLREADAKKDEFLAVLAHELRNPLAPIRSGIDLLQAEGAAPDARARATAMMDRQLGHIVRLVDDLLDASRIRTGKLQVTLQPMRLDEAIHAALEVVRPALQSKGQMLQIGGIDSRLRVAGDRVRLAQVFANLVSNATRYTPERGWISVRVVAHERSVDVVVTDNGPGLGGDSSRLFEPFYQAGGAASREGIGLGLTLVKGLTELHHGTVQATNRPEGGAMFTVTLPLLRLEDVNAKPPAAAPAGHAQASRRVLVVDDNRDAADALAALLDLRGDVVRVVDSGAAAIEEAASFQPEVIFMDVGMRPMDGLEATRRIRALPLAARPFIAALTGWGKDADRRATQAAGCDAHMVKPVDFDDVVNILRQADAAA